jgi:hypothetical protein
MKENKIAINVKLIEPFIDRIDGALDKIRKDFSSYPNIKKRTDFTELALSELLIKIEKKYKIKS